MRGAVPSAAALLDEAFTGLWRARALTVVSVLQIAVSVFLVGCFLLAAENLKGVTDAVRDETVATVFLSDAATEEQKRELERLAAESRLVASARRVSAEEARRRFAASWESLARAARSLPANPFPETLELDLLRDAVGSEALPGFLRLLASRPGVEEVQFDVDWIRRLRGAVTLARLGGLLVGVVLALGAAFTIANVVRLTILLHRDEIEVLRLVGAPELLIRGPFLVGGLVQGLAGGGLALAALWGAFRLLVLHVASTHNLLLGVFVVRFLPAATALLLVAGGLVAGLVGGVVAVRRRDLSGT